MEDCGGSFPVEEVLGSIPGEWAGLAGGGPLWPPGAGLQPARGVGVSSSWGSQVKASCSLGKHPKPSQQVGSKHRALSFSAVIRPCLLLQE